MTEENERTVIFNGKEVRLIGKALQVGDMAPEFHAHNNDWAVVPALASTRGKIRIIGSFLSLSTSVCDRETRRFNQEAAALGEGVAILMVSMDLPFTQKDWCAAAGVERVTTLSDHLEAEFGHKYGVLLEGYRFLHRAIFVVDRDDKIVYVDYMQAPGDEPNYAEVLKAAKST